ncbi:NAD(P)-dependent oxidoreductase [Candidatus Bipolaricaulota bacterium]|nr:NAD(P)-dependent oxidoreductase [Candidatus Bipolaricaulota bacterium]
MILLTGATGFFGVNATNLLLTEGKDVLATDISGYPDKALSSFSDNGNLEFVESDIRDRQQVRDLFENYKITEVIHAAAVTILGSEGIDNSRLIMEVNAKGSFELMDAAYRDQNVESFVYVSSSGVYGNYGSGRVPVHEDIPYTPSTFYVAAKIYSELLCKRYDEFSDRPFTIGRIGSPYGPWERPTGVRERMSPLYQLTHAGFSGEKIKIYGEEYLRDWTHMGDTARGIISLSQASDEELEYGTYNVALGMSVSLDYILGRLSKFTPDFNHEFVGKKAQADLIFENEYNRGPLDISRIRQDCNYQPEYDIDKGLKQYTEWIKEVESPE